MESAATADSLIGATIGNYEIKNKLGVGGMGSVYLAEHPLIGKRVALKVLHPEFSSNQEHVARFFNEAKSVNDIQHPNIVDILDYGVIPEDGRTTVYFIMEFLDGPSLAELVRAEAPLSPERALTIALQVADALGASHSHGIVHRDLKPDNVMLTRRGRETDFVKVLDFGIAKLTDTDKRNSVRTRTGFFLGTPVYMSPEQCDGAGHIDQRTDIYSLGILLFEMLTGQVPFQAEGAGAVMLQHMTKQPPRPSIICPNIPEHVEAVVLKALEKRADDRIPDMDEFMKAMVDPVGYVEQHGGISAFLGARLDSTSIPLPSSLNSRTLSIAPLTPSPDHGRKRSSVVIALVALLGIAIGGLLLLLWPQVRAIADSAADSQVAGAGGAGAGGAGAGVSADTTPRLRTGQSGDSGDTADRQAGDVAHGGARAAGTGTLGAGQGSNGDSDGAAVPDDTKADGAGAISVTIVSKPAGAGVYIGDEDQPRGETPLQFDMLKGDERTRLTLRLDGYKPIERPFAPDTNKEFEIQLERERSRASRRSRNRGDSASSSKSRRERQSERQKQPKADSDGKRDKDSSAKPEKPNRPNRVDKIERDVGLENPFDD